MLIYMLYLLYLLYLGGAGSAVYGAQVHREEGGPYAAYPPHKGGEESARVPAAPPAHQDVPGI
jgi:hypothetical protein